MSLGPRNRSAPEIDARPGRKGHLGPFPEPPCTPRPPADPPPIRLPDGFCTTEPDGGLLRMLSGLFRTRR